MKFGKSLGLLVLFIPVFSFAAQNLQISQQEQKLLGIEVQTIAAVEEGGAGEITLRVAFAPDGEWAIKTPLAGALQRVFVQQGDRVKTGDPLVIVRSADMVALQRDFLKARAELNLQVSNWKRDQQLGEAGSISERRWQETRFNHDTAQAEYAGLRGELMLAGFSASDLNRLSEKMEIGPDITLRAPVDAVVLETPAMLGDQLDGSELLVKLGEMHKLVLEGNLSRSAAAHLGVGGQIASQDDGTRAALTFVSSVIDPQTQTVHVRAQPREPSKLQPGQLTRWNVLSKGLVLTVPSNAVVKLEGRDVVYLSVPSGFDVRDVVVKSTGSGAWVVISGLATGDRVAVAGTAALKAMSMGIGGGDE
ncbi:MAG: efflux RND transporter periplasmic adaptor subunit [Lysobacterales bacterium]